MRPYRRMDKQMLNNYRTASPLGRLFLLLGNLVDDVASLWIYGAPFPTFLKLLGTGLLVLLVLLPLVYPLFVVALTYYTYEGLLMSLWTTTTTAFHPRCIMTRLCTSFDRGIKFHSPARARQMRRVFARCLLVAHSFTTAVDYLCVMQGLVNDF